MAEIKTIGVLTSGGDAPGMNAAVRAVVRTALYKGLRVYGIRYGYQGLLDEDIFEMNVRSVSEIIQRGGTTLYTARSTEFNSKVGEKKAVDICRQYSIDALVCIGGDGTFRGAEALTKLGLPCIGVPATIDNDIVCTDFTIGFDTACNTAVEMIDKLRDTTRSHSRCSIVEVMGHKDGTLALNIGIACGAMCTLIPEEKTDIQAEVIDKMLITQRAGKSHFIIVVAEGWGNSNELAAYITEHTGIETRVTVLGHVQRGGTPTARDRVMATRMGSLAVELLCEGKEGRVVCFKDGKITDFDIVEALNMEKTVDEQAFRISNMISL